MKRAVAAAAYLMLACAAPASLADEVNFSAADVIAGVQTDQAQCEGARRIWVEIGGAGDCLRFYGSSPAGGNATARVLVYLEGDVVAAGNRFDNNVMISSISTPSCHRPCCRRRPSSFRPRWVALTSIWRGLAPSVHRVTICRDGGSARLP